MIDLTDAELLDFARADRDRWREAACRLASMVGAVVEIPPPGAEVRPAVITNHPDGSVTIRFV